MPEIKTFDIGKEPSTTNFEKAQGGFNKFFDIFGSLDRFTKIGLLVMGIIILSTPLLIYKTATLFTHAQSATSQQGIIQPGTNPIQIENQNPGDPNWQIVKPSSGQPSTTINPNVMQGYSWATSVFPGETITFSARTGDIGYKIDVYRLGWYSGIGARHIYSSTVSCPNQSCWQNDPKVDPATGIDPANWPESFSIPIGTNWVTGAYLVKLTTQQTGYQAYVPFTVKSLSAPSLIFVNAVNTYQAYNEFGGENFYQDNSKSSILPGRAFQVSFDRPYLENSGSGHALLTWEYQLIRWLEKNGINVNYLTDTELDQSPLNVSHFYIGAKAIVFAGHDEYCSRNARTNLTNALASGVSLAFFGANNCFRQIRYSNGNQPGSNNLNDRVITSYDQPGNLDPLATQFPDNAALQERLSPVPNKPEQTLLGEMFVGGFSKDTYFDWRVLDPNSFIFQGTGLTSGQIIKSLIGGETDFQNTAYPMPVSKGPIDIISSSPVIGSNGKSFTSQSTVYQAPSGAYVFNAGTFIWSWFLDPFVTSNVTRNNFSPSSNDQKIVQIMTTNLLSQFGINGIQKY